MTAIVPHSVGDWLPVLLLVGLILNGLRLRAHARALTVLAPAPEPVRLQHLFVTAAGVRLDPDTRRAASAFADQAGLDVLDLVPVDLPTGRAFDFARMVAPAKYRGNRLAAGRGAFHALLVDVGVAERAGVTRLDGLDPVEMAELTVRLKRYACASTDLAVAPGLRATPEQVDKRRALLRVIYSDGVRIALAFPAMVYAGLIAGVALHPVWGALTVLAFCAQPYLVFAGRGGLRPGDLHQAALLRIVLDPARWLRTLTGRWQPPAAPDPYERLAAQYAAEVDPGLDHLFEERRVTCPWCGSIELSPRLRTSDLVQRKPGRFVLEQCRDCGHIFQNPRLSLAGLDYYYRDFYDGLGAEQTEFLFGTSGTSYRGRAEMVRPFTTPRAWLDVGAGHGHFCNLAQDSWPDTVFDGLDLSASIEEAERRRWISRGYRGLFPDLAADLVGRYDVVSMHHYLEHTREPTEELDAARKILPVGGYLLIEVPNPESRAGRFLGRWWVPWFQPQHQHLIPVGNLVRALEDRGFAPVAIDRGRAHQPVDLTGALALAVNAAVPNPQQPWLSRRPTRFRRFAHITALTAALPMFAITLLIDYAIGGWIRRTNGGNTYRVLARVAD